MGISKTITIVGVIEDYRVKPLVNLRGVSSEEASGRGICLVYKNHVVPWFAPERIAVRVEPGKLEDAIKGIEKSYAEAFPRNIFTWYFLDDHINKAYDNEKIVRNQISLFTFLAIGISCLGLLGMMALVAEEKTKEIGIRKVLGAGMKEISSGLLRNVVMQLVAALVIAMPISIYLARQYLERYTERIGLQ